MPEVAHVNPPPGSDQSTVDGTTATTVATEDAPTVRLADLLTAVEDERHDRHRSAYLLNVFAWVGLVGGALLALLAGSSALAELTNKAVIGALGIASASLTTAVAAARPGQRHLYHLRMFKRVSLLELAMSQYKKSPDDRDVFVPKDVFDGFQTEFREYQDSCYKEFVNLEDLK